jgi:hypothetical protein
MDRIKFIKFLETLWKYQLLKNNSAPWSLLIMNIRKASCGITYKLSTKDDRFVPLFNQASQYEGALRSEGIA